MQKLIIIRGPSGSGKSTTAKALRGHFKTPVALVELDYFRVTMMSPSAESGAAAKKMAFTNTHIALNHGYSVILESIFTAGNYKPYFDELFVSLDKDIQKYMFYFDVTFAETLNRHSKREKAQDFGEADMRQWYTKPESLGYDFEYRIPERFSPEQALEFILAKTGVK